MLSGSKDRGVQFWDPRTGDTQLMLQGHKNSGTFIKIPNSAMGTLIADNSGHLVISVAPSPTGELFATGSGDMRARIWRSVDYLKIFIENIRTNPRLGFRYWSYQ